MSFTEAGKKLGKKVVQLAKGGSTKSSEYSALASGDETRPKTTKKKNKRKTRLEGGNDSLLSEQKEEPYSHERNILEGTYKPIEPVPETA